MNNRDDFSSRTKNLIANRVGVRCSNPNCRKPTSGANSNPEKIINIGVAAHICAAAAGGPRYDANMTSRQRKSSHNGIWLCQSCAKLIDSDEKRYTTELLHSWKHLAEVLSTVELEKPTSLQICPSEQSFRNYEILQGHWFQQSDENTVVKWGYRSLDDIYTITPGTIILLAGYSNVDISMLAQNITCFNAKANCNIIYFNLKESSDSIVMKLLAAEALVDADAIRIGKLGDEEWQRISCATTVFKNSNILFESYDVNQSMSDYLLSAIKYGHADLIIIDDLGGLSLEKKMLNSFLYELRSVASEAGTTVLMVLDISDIPSRMDTRPIVSDSQIREFSKFCDVIQFLYFDEQTNMYFKPDSIPLEFITAKYFTSPESTIVHLLELPRYATILEYENNTNFEKGING